MIGIALGVLLLVGSVLYHAFFSGSGVIDPTRPAGPASQKGGVFAFLKQSLHWKKKPVDIFDEDQLEKIGIPSGTTRVFNAGRDQEFKNKKRMFALRKYEGIKRLGDDRLAAKEEFYRRMNRPEARQLKDAIVSLDMADNLGIMKLENLLQEKLLKDGGRFQDIDLMVFAFKKLGQVYQKKNMQEKSKEAYLQVFRLMKEQAPAEQGPEWDKAISEVEKLSARAPRN